MSTKNGNGNNVGARTHPRRALFVAALIIAAGPLIGGLIFIAAFGVKELVGSPGTPMGALLEVSYYARQLIFAFYAIGLVPAFLSSIWIGWLIYRCGTFGYSHAVIGAIVMTIVLPGTVFLTSLLLRGAQIGRPMSYLVVGAIMALIAVLSALTLRWLLGAIGVLPSSGNSHH